MKQLIILFAFCTLSSFAIAQRGAVKGKILDGKTGKAINEALVTIKERKVATSTDGGGNFSISNLPYGSYELHVEADGYEDDDVSATVNSSVEKLDDILLTPTEKTSNDVSGDANQATSQDNGDDDNGTANSQNVGSALNASRDPFNSAAQFSWGQYYFKQRGYENEHNVTLLNGIPMNELEDGNASFNVWAGLNDVFRSRSMTVGLATSDLTYGGLGNTTTLDASASVQRKQTRVTYSSTNRGYRNRVMLTHSTGVMKNGWAFSVSGSRRWANKGAIPGTWQDSYSYFAAAEKRMGKHSVSLTAVGAPTQRAKTGVAMQEVFDLVGSNLYNPNWGYQNGQMRSARVLNQFVPLFILSDEITLKNNGKILAAVSYQSGNVSNTRINFYNAANPAPDYYSYLPSYTRVDIGEAAGNAVEAAIKANPEFLQINWDRFYAGNKLGSYNVAGVAGNRSNYLLYADVEHQRRLNAAINYEKAINQHMTCYFGVTGMSQKMHYYQKVVDLLGGDYWYDVNGFAERTFGNGPQTEMNLLDINKVKKVGDQFGYNYNLNFSKVAQWAQLAFTYNKVDFFVANSFSYTSYFRDGLTKVGLYPNNSLGASAKTTFVNAGAKGGFTYKLNGRNYLYANGGFGTNAPLFDNVYVSPRTRNEKTQTVVQEQMRTMEAGYLLRSPSVKARFTYFNTSIANAADIKRYFDPVSNSFANMAVTNIKKNYEGVEIGAEVKLTNTITINAATSLTRALYTNRPTVNTFVDNDTSSEVSTQYGSTDSMFSKYLHLPNGPQTAFNIGGVYRSPKFWMANITFNYMGDNYIDFAPNKHISSYVDLIKFTQGEDVYNSWVTQKKLNPFYTVDISWNKSWRATKFVKKAPTRSLIFLNLSISNVFNNTNIQLSGFEQLRVDRARPTLFDAKYAYAMGRQYFVNLAYSF